MFLLVIFQVTALSAILGVTAWNYQRHRARLKTLDAIIHVNGIRGKSTVTRLLHGALTESGRPSIAKTTGTYACVLDANAGEHPIRRRSAPNILEQFDVIKRWVRDGTQALVIECMAVRPEYQRFCQEKIVQAPITVITNVRLDHQEEMGDTVEEIARSLCVTVPEGGLLVTGEQDPNVLAVMEEEVAQRNSRLVVADVSSIDQADVDKYEYLQFAENLAVVNAVCAELGVSREVAMRGMLASQPDPGVVIVKPYEIDGKIVHWAPMFAVNDQESTISVLDEIIKSRLPQDCEVVAVLNNRNDRVRRAKLFADIVTNEVPHQLSKVALLGELEGPIADRMIKSGQDEKDIILTSDIDTSTGESIVKGIIANCESREVALVGMVNIHTDHAVAVCKYFDQLSSSNESIEDLKTAFEQDCEVLTVQ